MSRRPWTDTEIRVLRELYPDTPTAEIAAQIGREIPGVYHKAKKMGLKKSAAYLASPAAARIQPGDGKGAATRFLKGQQPWNKGTSYVAGGRSEQTRYQPGHVPHTYRPIGTERWRQGYLWRKVRDDQPIARHNWRQVHLILWEDHQGPVPDNHCVVFRNGDHADIRLDNLELISRADLGRRNSMHRLPDELKRTIRVKSALTRQINRIEKEART